LNAASPLKLQLYLFLDVSEVKGHLPQKVYMDNPKNYIKMK